MMKKESAAKPANLEALRHSASHVMAQAVMGIFPEAKLGIGPAIEDGFYYDFDLPRTLTPEDLGAIEQKMREAIRANLPLVRRELTREEAHRLLANQPYKIELLEAIPEGEPISTYTQGDFTDLCQGPHVESTGGIGAFKLLSIAGAYWRGDEHRPMLQRVYGTAFSTQKELDVHLERLEEAGRRDHRTLGKSLDLFSIHEEAGPGLIFWHPKGAQIRLAIEDFWRQEHQRRGYQFIYSPHIARLDLWKTSGHWEWYQEYMYSPMDIDEQQYVVKPMNCPGHILVFKSHKRSYRELPLRWAELGTVYRYERSGVLHGLTRVRGFTQDDAHIFCRPDQLENEIIGVIRLVQFMMKTFQFEQYEVMLSTRPEKAAGSLEIWEEATSALSGALEALEAPYEIDPGEGVFYGPKIDVKLKDALGRTWQGPTIQVDFNLPIRFDMNYIGEDGMEHRPVMVHRAVLGSMERFLGCLVEHFAGAFPVWLSPVQAVVIPIADRHIDYARQVQDRMLEAGVRVDVDARSERMNAKVRDAQMQKVPYMLIVGDQELAAEQVAVRLRNGQNLGPQSVGAFLSLALDEIKEKR
ncbi:MAG: threonine--tRNA ligase [Dehalococcoidia bacterium]|nr:threonine--tRNA ligase [Dehalococcoidia bacterium]